MNQPTNRFNLQLRVVCVDHEGDELFEFAGVSLDDATTDGETLEQLMGDLYEKAELLFKANIAESTVSPRRPDDAGTWDDEERFLRLQERSGGDPRLSGLYGQGDDDFDDDDKLRQWGSEYDAEEPGAALAEADRQALRGIAGKPVIRFPGIFAQLTGENGNALSLIGIVGLALKKAGVPGETISEFKKEALSGDYDHVLRTCQEWVNCG